MSDSLSSQQDADIHAITKHFSVSGEITEAQLDTLVSQGVDTLINVRPDNECENQTSNHEWQALAKKHHIGYVFVPVKPCQYSEQDVKKFKEALAQSSSSVHGFCRTGTRAAHLWALANRENVVFSDMQRILKDAGYDLDMIAEMFKGPTKH